MGISPLRLQLPWVNFAHICVNMLVWLYYKPHTVGKGVSPLKKLTSLVVGGVDLLLVSL